MLGFDLVTSCVQVDAIDVDSGHDILVVQLSQHHLPTHLGGELELLKEVLAEVHTGSLGVHWVDIAGGVLTHESIHEAAVAHVVVLEPLLVDYDSELLGGARPFFGVAF